MGSYPPGFAEDDAAYQRREERHARRQVERLRQVARKCVAVCPTTGVHTCRLCLRTGAESPPHRDGCPVEALETGDV